MVLMGVVYKQVPESTIHVVVAKEDLAVGLSVSQIPSCLFIYFDFSFVHVHSQAMWADSCLLGTIRVIMTSKDHEFVFIRVCKERNVDELERKRNIRHNFPMVRTFNQSLNRFDWSIIPAPKDVEDLFLD